MTYCRPFIAEATELLREMESGLLDCSRGEATEETINLIFRTAHTIKGSAGLFGLDAIVSFVHGVETLLDRAPGRSAARPETRAGACSSVRITLPRSSRALRTPKMALIRRCSRAARSC